MTVDTTLTTLQRDVRYLLDRTEILDCIARHARGCDRHDIDLIASAYHSDGVDEHGRAVNAGPDYGEWANKTHAETSESTPTTSPRIPVRSTARPLMRRAT